MTTLRLQDFTIRRATAEDSPFLWRMLTFAASMEGHADDVARAQSDPDLRLFVDDYGRESDLGLVAVSGEELLGAAWLRLGTGKPSPTKVWTESIPELVIATTTDARGCGVGSALLTSLFALARYPEIALTVRDGNPAVRLYERHGFTTQRRITNRVGGVSLVMTRRSTHERQALMHEHFIDVGTGRRLRYLEGGKPDGPPLLMLHGVHLRADYFARSIAPHLAQDYRLIAPDLRGHGGSFFSGEPYFLRSFAADVVALHAALIHEPCRLLGLSLGGNVALQACVQAPGIARALVSVDIAPFVNREGVERLARAQSMLPESFASRSALFDFFHLAYQAVSRAYVDELLVHMWKQDEAGLYVRAYDRRVWELPLEPAVTELANLAEAARDLTLPILLLRGEQSDILTREGAARFLAMLRDGRVEEIAGVGHGLVHERPAECAAVIRSFFGT